MELVYDREVAIREGVLTGWRERWHGLSERGRVGDEVMLTFLAMRRCPLHAHGWRSRKRRAAELAKRFLAFDRSIQDHIVWSLRTVKLMLDLEIAEPRESMRYAPPASLMPLWDMRVLFGELSACDQKAMLWALGLAKDSLDRARSRAPLRLVPDDGPEAA